MNLHKNALPFFIQVDCGRKKLCARENWFKEQRFQQHKQSQQISKCDHFGAINNCFGFISQVTASSRAICGYECVLGLRSGQLVGQLPPDNTISFKNWVQSATWELSTHEAASVNRWLIIWRTPPAMMMIVQLNSVLHRNQLSALVAPTLPHICISNCRSQ